MSLSINPVLSPIAQTALQNKFEELQVEVQRIRSTLTWNGIDVLAGKQTRLSEGLRSSGVSLLL